MSKKRKASTGEETQGSYITLGDGTKVSEVLYLSTYTILNNFASGKDGMFGYMALYDIGQKALNPDYEIYSQKCQEPLKEFLDQTGRIPDDVAAIVRNLVLISEKRAFFIGKPQGSSLSDLYYNDESSKEKKHKNEDDSLDNEETETEAGKDEIQDPEEEEDVDEVFEGEPDENGEEEAVSLTQPSPREASDINQDDSGYEDEELDQIPEEEEDDDVDDVYGSRTREEDDDVVGGTELVGLFQEEDGA